jgi:hypothetical protein
MHLRTLLAVTAAALCLAAPASAQQGTLVIPDEAPVCTGVGDTTTACTTDGTDPGGETVGEGQVITDPADEIEDVDSSVEAAPKRGSLEIEGGTSASSSAEPASAPAAPAVPAAADAAPAAGAPAQVTTAAPSSPSAKTLPFTGVDAGPLALIGALMLLAGLGLRRVAGDTLP